MTRSVTTALSTFAATALLIASHGAAHPWPAQAQAGTAAPTGPTGASSPRE